MAPAPFSSPALAAVRIKKWRSVRELVMLQAWLDTWSGLGAIVVGMQRHRYDLSLKHDRNGWRATFLHQSHVLHPWVGQVLHWWPTPWRAMQEAAWRALNEQHSERRLVQLVLPFA